jgi:hypothetical protein
VRRPPTPSRLPYIAREVISLTARGRLHHARFRWSSSCAGTVLLLCLSATACGSDDEEKAPFQRVAYCQAPSSDNPQGDPVEIEFRQDGEIVARAGGSPGTAVTVEVPLGHIEIWSNGAHVADVNEGVDPARYVEPGPKDVTYVASSAEGCPKPPLR